MKNIKIFFLCFLLLGGSVVFAFCFEQTQAALWLTFLCLILAAVNLGSVGFKDDK
ncbi:hypothetical protein K0H59_20395 [Shewanella sp. FJAT-51649]|uniref:hypothetical protein n=1 Tax=Shewanella sp. FJAT-51649 TaxID=2864210 RepID=UPI001C655CED|nr:hypothetical protein [Shewanella sp. FJAT-51649]QYJ71338.1 hypothetical protein K0H59_20395 [Shewanella sp. FJAT-51649]